MCGGGGNSGIKETREQKELARIALERWQRYGEIGVPAENKYIDYVTNQVNSESRQNLAAGAASGAVASSFGRAVQSDIARMTSEGTGVNPNSGKFKAAVQERQDQEGAARLAAVEQSKQQLDDDRVRGLQNIVAIGNNAEGVAIGGLQDAANTSAYYANQSAVQDFRNDMSDQAFVGQAVGFGAGMYNGRREDD